MKVISKQANEIARCDCFFFCFQECYTPCCQWFWIKPKSTFKFNKILSFISSHPSYHLTILPLCLLFINHGVSRYRTYSLSIKVDLHIDIFLAVKVYQDTARMLYQPVHI